MTFSPSMNGTRRETIDFPEYRCACSLCSSAPCHDVGHRGHDFPLTNLRRNIMFLDRSRSGSHADDGPKDKSGARFPEHVARFQSLISKARMRTSLSQFLEDAMQHAREARHANAGSLVGKLRRVPCPQLPQPRPLPLQHPLKA